jgi:DNA-binding NarL/FixJ family response regulator
LSVFVVSPNELLAGALVAVLTNSPDLGGAEAVIIEELADALAATDDEHVVVMHGDDVEPGYLTRVAAAYPVLVLGSGGSDEMIAAVDAGAMGYLDAESSLEAIKDAVISLAKGVAMIEPRLLGSLLRHVVGRRREQAQARRALEVLTPRENEVFRLLARGLGSQQAAQQLYISLQTVRTHTRRIMNKLDLHSRSELVALAARCGLELEVDGGGDD